MVLTTAHRLYVAVPPITTLTLALSLNLLWPHLSPAIPQICPVHSCSALASLSACDALSPSAFEDNSPTFFLFFSERGREGERGKRNINWLSPARAPNLQSSHMP